MGHETRFLGQPRASRQTPPENLVRSVSRALRIVEVVSASPVGLPVKVIARRCELNLSTTYHLVRTLTYEGYLVRRPEGLYVAGDQLTRRFYDVLDGLGRPPEAPVVLRDLSARTGLSAYLGRIRDGQTVVVDYVEGPGSPYLEEFERGLSVSLHATALGKALLLAMPAEVRRAVLREQGTPRFTGRTVASPEELEAELAPLSHRDVVVEHGEFREGVACAAALVPASDGGRPQWAVVVSARDEDLPAGVLAELSLAARDLASIAESLVDRRA